MNIALSILSAAASAEAAGTAEAYSGPWENVYNAVHSTAEAVTEEAQGVVDRIQGLGDAHAQLADPDYWGSVGIITLTGILVVFFILAILIFLFWALGKTFQTIDKNRAAKAEAAKKAAVPAPAALCAGRTGLYPDPGHRPADVPALPRHGKTDLRAYGPLPLYPASYRRHPGRHARSGALQRGEHDGAGLYLRGGRAGRRRL